MSQTISDIPTDSALTVAEDPAAAARSLARELARIDEQIRSTEIEAGRQTDENRVTELLTERRRLERRRESLPFLLRGAQSRALRAQAAALRAEAAAADSELQEAIAETIAATERHADLERQAREAAYALAVADRRRSELVQQYEHLTRSAGLAETDAHRIEQGLEPLENRFAEPD